MLAYDSARAAEKLADPNCAGRNNVAWQEGPFLAAYANHEALDYERPYILRTSDEHGAAAGIVMGEEPERSSNGGIRIPLPPANQKGSRIEPVIAKLIIIEQFELFKEFLISIEGPYNKKRQKEWEGLVEEKVLDSIVELADRRNELTHESTYRLPEINEAVIFFYRLREMAPVLLLASRARECS